MKKIITILVLSLITIAGAAQEDIYLGYVRVNGMHGGEVTFKVNHFDGESLDLRQAFSFSFAVHKNDDCFNMSYLTSITTTNTFYVGAGVTLFKIAFIDNSQHFIGVPIMFKYLGEHLGLTFSYSAMINREVPNVLMTGISISF